jgi:hypothetical protein
MFLGFRYGHLPPVLGLVNSYELGFIDPYGIRYSGWPWHFVFKSVRISIEGGFEHLCTLINNKVSQAVVKLLRRYQANLRVMMFFVIPGEKGLTESPCMLDTTEFPWELWAVLEGFKLLFRKGVVIADVRLAMAFDNAKVR